jgi:hypothetical protein
MKIIYILTIYSISIISLLSQSTPKLSESEIKGIQKFNFLNKSNKKADNEMKAYHDSIGKKMSSAMTEEPERIHTIEGLSIFRIQSAGNLLGADVLSISENKVFGHVNSLNRIISSYVQHYFQYPEDNADLLAKYILYYNAIYRKDINYILTKYNNQIEDRVNSNNLGISQNYKQWPGKTQIIIPLEKNILKKFDTDITLSELGDSVNKIIDEKKDGAKDKKKFEELIETKKKEEKDLIAQKKKELTKEEANLEKKKKELDIKLNEVASNDNDKRVSLLKEKEKIEEKIEKIEEKKDALEDREDKIDGKEKSETEVTKTETENQPVPEEEKKVTETVSLADQEAMKKDLEKLKEELNSKAEDDKKKVEFSSNVIDGKIPFIKVDLNLEGQCASEMHLLDPTKDDFVFKGEFSQICGRTFKEFGGNLLVIGLKDSKDQIRLILLGKKDLKPSGYSEVNVYQRSFMEISENNLYAIESDNGKYYLSRFDMNLKRILRTDVDVSADSVITIYGSKIYTNGRNEAGKVEIKVFNKADLKFLKKTQV